MGHGDCARSILPGQRGWLRVVRDLSGSRLYDRLDPVCRWVSGHLGLLQFLMPMMRRTVLLAAMLLALTSVGFAEGDDGIPFSDTFERFTRQPGSILISRPTGGVVALVRSEGAFGWWNARGKLEGSCKVETLGFSVEQAFAMAESEGRILVSTIETSAVGGRSFRGYIIDLGRCRVGQTLDFPAPVFQVARTRDDWVVEMLPVGEGPSTDDRWPGCDVVRIDDEGRLGGPFPPPRGLSERWAERGIGSGLLTPSVFGRLVLAGKTHWFIPAERYEFWRPRQRGRPEFMLRPPACLQSREKILDGANARAEIRRRFDDVPEGERAQFEAALDEGTHHTRIPAVSAAATYGDLLAVTVRSAEEGTRSCRLDVWDMALEQLMFSTVLGGEECHHSGFLALGDDVVWTLDDRGRVVVTELPVPLVPLVRPCSMPGP